MQFLLFRILLTSYRPNTGLSQFEEHRNDLFSKYEQIDPKDAEEGWTEQYVTTQDKCIHGDTCKHKGSCTSKCETTNIIIGSWKNVKITDEVFL